MLFCFISKIKILLVKLNHCNYFNYFYCNYSLHIFIVTILFIFLFQLLCTFLHICLTALVLVQVLVRGRDPLPGRRRFRPGQPLTRLIRHLQCIPKQVQGIQRSDLGLVKSAWDSRPPQLVNQLDSTPHPGVHDFIPRLGGLGRMNK